MNQFHKQGEYITIMAMFASFIIRLFQLVFLAGIVFFSHNKPAGTVFYPNGSNPPNHQETNLESEWLLHMPSEAN